MPRKEGTKHLQIYMAQEALDAVNEHARSKGYKITSEYLRDLIQKDIEADGKSIDFGIDRGGWRGEPKDQPQDDD